MKRVLQSPAKYIQGAGILAEIGDNLRKLGSKPFFIATETGFARVQERLQASLDDVGMPLEHRVLAGECSMTNVNKLLDELGRTGCDNIQGAV